MTSKPASVHIFWDDSNIFIEGRRHCETAESQMVASDFRIHFENLYQLAAANRRDAAPPRLTLKPMTLFQDTYRVESARKAHWDYTLPGWYFVTICTERRRPYFGRIVHATMNLSVLGDYAAKCWQEIPSHHSNIGIDDFIVMPNHFHGIIVMAGPERLPELHKHEKTKRIAKLSEVHPTTGSLGTVVGSFKSAVSYWCTSQKLPFRWQPRFHDRIIRGKNSLKAVREYIRDNPKNWGKDTEFIPQE